MRVLAIIPAYNEQECIEDTVDELVRVCPQADYLVVNDGSADDTPKILDRRGFNHIDLPVNCGLPAGVQAGMKYALRNGYDAAVQYDADGQHMPAYLAPMAQAIEQGADIVIASRGAAGSGAVGARGAGAKLITWLIRRTTHQTIQDPTSGMRMYNRHMMEIFANGFDITPEPDTVALLIRKGSRVVEVPAQMRERQGGTSYLRFMSSIRYMLRTCLSLMLFQWFR